MSELLKEFIRRAIFLFVPDEMIAEHGTLKWHFLNWLYGNGEPEFDAILPDREKWKK